MIDYTVIPRCLSLVLALVVVLVLAAVLVGGEEKSE